MKIVKSFLLISILFILSTGNNFPKAAKQKIAGNAEAYQCLPCGSDCDKEIFNKPGTCPHCQMKLVKKSTVKFNNIKPTEICDYIREHPNTVLLDVRTKEEFEGRAEPNFGTLKNAINIPIQELENRLLSIKNLKKKEIIVFCSHSRRSPQASYLLNQNGFRKIINMSGGMSTMKDSSCIK